MTSLIASELSSARSCSVNAGIAGELLTDERDEPRRRRTDGKVRVLLAEDNILIAMDLAAEFEASGMVISGMTSTVAGALELIDRGDLDCAVLNIGLKDGDCFPAARRLRTLGIPFAFLTTYEKSEIAPEFRDVPHILKPMSPSRIVRFVADLAGGKAPCPGAGADHRDPRRN